jgi:hypothetical protein
LLPWWPAPRLLQPCRSIILKTKPEALAARKSLRLTHRTAADHPSTLTLYASGQPHPVRSGPALAPHTFAKDAQDCSCVPRKRAQIPPAEVLKWLLSSSASLSSPWSCSRQSSPPFTAPDP